MKTFYKVLTYKNNQKQKILLFGVRPCTYFLGLTDISQYSQGSFTLPRIRKYPEIQRKTWEAHHPGEATSYVAIIHNGQGKFFRKQTDSSNAF
jgi:hypothetical protein